MLRLAVALFAAQAGFHAFTASLPLALAHVGFPDAEIGLIVGAAAVVQMPAALLAGAAIDRFGGMRLFLAGAVAYALGALILLVSGVARDTSTLALLAARVLQGVGIASVIPSALALVPTLVPRARQGFGLAFMGSAHNLTMGLLPPVSLALLAAASMRGVALFVLVAVGIAMVLASGIRGLSGGEATDGSRASTSARSAAGRLRFVYRRAWTAPLLLTVLFAAHWGVVVAYLPQRAAEAGADIGLFFAADAFAIFIARVPTGWLADRTSSRLLLLVGVIVTLAALTLLLPRPSTGLLVLAGIGTGIGGGFIVSPLLLELARRSGPADRGSAFALFSVAFAAALSLGSIGGAPIITVGGFGPAILAGMAGLAAAGVLAFADPSLRGSPPALAHETLVGPAVDSPGLVELPPLPGRPAESHRARKRPEEPSASRSPLM